MIDRRLLLVLAAGGLWIVAPLRTVSGGGETDSIAAALESVDADVRVYNDHLTTLASPFMEGRVPGSRGMEVASEYVEFWFRKYGLEAPFPRTETAVGGEEVITPRASHRQPFPLSGTLEITGQSLSVEADGRSVTFEPEKEFRVTGLGGAGELSAPVVFVGYSIDNGPEGYSSYGEGDDLSGKVALMLRFEPMNDKGLSRWSENGPWSDKASFANKLRAARERQASAIIVINTPGADDPRAVSLDSMRGDRKGEGCPVIAMTAEGGERFVQATDPQHRSLMDLRHLADESGGLIELSAGTATIGADMVTKPLIAENVGGLLPGRGALAEQYIVVGAHLDHLGMGYFGSRSGPGKLHPGADDNASGSAGILLLAEKLAASYAQLPEGTDARSVLFIAFSAEESGLHGSRYYVDHPIAPLEKHALMVNFDMIGRITNDRLRVSGVNSAEELEEWLKPFFDAAPLEIVASGGGPGGSDHMSFQQRSIPVLFGIIADFHGDYHTPEDVGWKINRVGAVQTVRLFHDIALAAAQRPQCFTFKGEGGGEGAEPGPRLADIKVRFGIIPGSYDEDQEGIAVRDVAEGGSAQQAGVQAGDVLVAWNKQALQGIRHWMTLLAAHQPGDTVELGVLRDGKEVTLMATLQAKQ
jgi:hypothetical protein